MITRRRRLALWLAERLRALAFWLDLKTVPRYRAGTWPSLDITDEEWAEWQSQIDDVPQ